MAEAVLEIQVDGAGGGGGQKTVPSVVAVWIFSAITQLFIRFSQGNFGLSKVLGGFFVQYETVIQSFKAFLEL